MSKYDKGLCLNKLDLIGGMIIHNVLTPEEVEKIWYMLNDVSHQIDEYIDRIGARNRKEIIHKKTDNESI